MLHKLADLPRRVLMAAVRGYRFALSPWLGSSCRFEPTCSAYALQALQSHGAAAGSYLTLKRLGRCHPWCQGGFDPVPDHSPAVFRALLNRRPARAVAATSPPDHSPLP